MYYLKLSKIFLVYKIKYKINRSKKEQHIFRACQLITHLRIFSRINGASCEKRCYRIVINIVD